MNRDFAAFVDKYFDSLFEWSPSYGTAAGLHQYDAKIEDYSQAAVSRRVETLKALDNQLQNLLGHLNEDDQIDAELLNGQIKSELLDLEVIQSWRHNPMGYVGLPGSAIDGLIKRNFAPPAERLKSVIVRLKGVPALMDAMKQNIDNPPHEFTDLAIRIAGGSVGFFRETIAAWARDAAGPDTLLLNDFNAANTAAAKSLEDATDWLKKTVLPKSKGVYAIGAETFAKKLAYEEMVDTSIDELVRNG